MVLQKKSCQSGNVLFLILIAVALFAALSYAITSSNRGGKTSTTSEVGEVTAGRILNFTTAVQGAVLRLSTINGVPPQELKYNNDVTTDIAGNIYMGAMGTPADPKLYVFHPQGGGVPAQKFEDAVTPCIGCGTAQVKGGHFNVVWWNAPGVGLDGTADVALFVLDLRDDACLAINRKLGVDFIPNVTLAAGNLIVASSTPPTNFGTTTGVTTADQTAIEGRLTMCVKKTNSPVRNQYISIIKAY